MAKFTDEQSRTPSPLCDLSFKLNNSQQFYCGSKNSFVQDCSRKGKILVAPMEIIDIKK